MSEHDKDTQESPVDPTEGGTAESEAADPAPPSQEAVVGEIEPAEPAQASIPETLPVLPLRGLVVYPYAALPLMVGQARSVQLVDDAMRGNRLVALVAQIDPSVENARPDQVRRIGTAARILQLLRRPDGGLMVAMQGLERIRIDEYVSDSPYLTARVSAYPDPEDSSLEVEALRRNAVAAFQQLVGLAQYLPEELATVVMNLEDTRQLIYLIAGSLQIDLEIKQEVLENDSLSGKLRKLNEVMSHELEVLELGRRIQGQAQEEMSKAQREYILREQLKAIQRELGESDDQQAEINELRDRLEKAQLSPEARKEADRELSRLERIPTASPEHSVIRTYIDLLISLPWMTSSGGEIDVPAARQILDEDHYDLEKIKDRILEYLAVRKMKHDRGIEGGPGEREPLLCLVGPPGVGKTSLGQSIARAMGRKFTRLSLGGVRDEAEVRGHRRTYIGAMPGSIIQALRRAGTNDPVFMLDEIDKVGSDWRGDPSSALLEVLDPEQNREFRDNYLDIPFDLSRVTFIATANNLDTIPPPLLDRMEVLQLPGYTEDEKVMIATRYLVPKQRRANGLTESEIVIEESAIREVVRAYTREAGVRTLERQIASLCRKVARQISERPADPAAVNGRIESDESIAKDTSTHEAQAPILELPNVTVDPAETKAPRDAAEVDLPEDASEGTSSVATAQPEVVDVAAVHRLLGREQFHNEQAERIDRPGVATGLVWTPVGGDIVFVEAARTPSKEERLILTGQLGEVMKESAQAALTCVRAGSSRLRIDPELWDQSTLHIHVPAGAVPKDGPSAGVTMALAVASLMTGRPVRADLALTGEITLRGKVLPVGGIKEKMLGAHRAGIRTVLLPRHNERDLEDLPPELREEMRFVLVGEIQEVFDEALLPVVTSVVQEAEPISA
ncbi:MAG TPA: endopeptidase La [Chloroflexota bacterium]|nr:endopeptidase La [Chloroflexota bacterium]